MPALNDSKHQRKKDVAALISHYFHLGFPSSLHRTENPLDPPALTELMTLIREEQSFF